MSRFVVTDIDGDRSGIGEKPYDRGSVPLGQRDAGGDRRMTTKRHLHQRTEVPDPVATCLLWNCGGKESGLGVADFGRDSLHFVLCWMSRTDDHTGGVPAGRISGECRQPLYDCHFTSSTPMSLARSDV